MSNGKGMIIHLIVGLIKRSHIKMSQYFPKPFNSHFGDSIKVKTDLSHYATKTDIKNISHVDTSSFALKTNLADLKTEVDKLDIDKLVPIPVDLSKLTDVVKNDVVKKTVYDTLVAKVDNIDISNFVLKNKYQTDKTELENKIPDVSNLVKKTKLTELENKIPVISNLASKTALTTAESKIPSVSNLVKKTDYKIKITDTESKLNNHNHDKYINTSEFNELAADAFNTRLAQANIIEKTDFDAKLLDLNRKITQNKSKHLLVENGLNKLKTFDSSYFIGESHFDEDGTQSYLVFQPMHRYFKMITNTDYISSWKSKESKGLSAASIKPPITSDNSLTPALNKIKFTGSCLRPSKISYTHGKVVNIYIVYELGASSSHVNDPSLKICLFCAVTFTKNADIDKYGIPVMELDLIEEEVFHFQVVNMV